MLLELYDRNHKKLANLTGIKSPHIQRTLEYGDETLDFSYPTSGPWLAQLLAECYIRTDRQEYVVKAVEKSSTSAWYTPLLCGANHAIIGLPLMWCVSRLLWSAGAGRFLFLL